MISVGFVVAMAEEAQPIINAYSLHKGADNVYTGVLGDFLIVLKVAGIGKVNAGNAAWELIASYDCDRVINVGTCGDCGDHGIGKAIIPKAIFDGDFDLSGIGIDTKDPANVNDYEGIVPMEDCCYTYSQFVTDSRISGAIVEMEAYAVASACKFNKVPFIAIKVVSDKADENAADSFAEQVENNVETNVVSRILPEIDNVLMNFPEVYKETYGKEL